MKQTCRFDAEIQRVHVFTSERAYSDIVGCEQPSLLGDGSRNRCGRMLDQVMAKFGFRIIDPLTDGAQFTGRRLDFALRGHVASSPYAASDSGISRPSPACVCMGL